MMKYTIAIQDDMQANQSSSVQIAILQSQLNTLQNENQVLNEKNMVLQDLCEQYTKKYKEVVSKNEMLELHKKYHVSISDTYSKDVYERKYEGLQRRVQYLEQKNKNVLSLLDENDTFRQKVKSLQTQLNVRNEDINILKQNEVNFYHHIHDLQQEINDKNMDINENQAIIDKLLEKLELMKDHEPESNICTMNRTLIIDDNNNINSPKISSLSSNIFCDGDNNINNTQNGSSFYAPFPDTDIDEEPSMSHSNEEP